MLIDWLQNLAISFYEEKKTYLKMTYVKSDYRSALTNEILWLILPIEITYFEP